MVAVVAALAGCAEAEVEVAAPEVASVERVGDGDTLDLRGGERVRLLQIDAPELGEGECYARASLRDLERLAGEGTRVHLEADPDLDDRDRYRRLLRYVRVDGTLVNLELVRLGAATPYFRGGDEGVHADALLAAVEEARADRRGMWGACRVTWEPDRAVVTRSR
ncbi:MAG TPA: thermonuclease family protein [Gaiellaceae bacterium]|nr:thermonuclease family protein [Gaiellaceae bacterium]